MSYNLVDPETGELTQVAGNIRQDIIPADASASNKLVTNDDIFRVGDRRNTIGWADLSNSVDIDGSSNFANNVGRIEGHNTIIKVSNPSASYQWPVTNPGDSNNFMDFGGAIQFFVDKVNNHLYVRFADSVDMSAWGELATMDKVANSIIRENKSVLYNLNNVDNIEVAIDIAKPGYKPIAVSLYNSGTHMWFAQGMYFNDTVCNLSLRGVTPTSATNAECEVLVTYIKTS